MTMTLGLLVVVFVVGGTAASSFTSKAEAAIVAANGMSDVVLVTAQPSTELVAGLDLPYGAGHFTSDCGNGPWPIKQHN